MRAQRRQGLAERRGLAVTMNSHLALKVGYRVRDNSRTEAGCKKTDALLTTNRVCGF